MKRYVLTGAQAFTHRPEHPDRTARKQGMGMNFDVTFQVWPNRPAMARSIRMQQKRENRQDDWSPFVPLSPGEGF